MLSVLLWRVGLLNCRGVCGRNCSSLLADHQGGKSSRRRLQKWSSSSSRCGALRVLLPHLLHYKLETFRVLRVLIHYSPDNCGESAAYASSSTTTHLG